MSFFQELKRRNVIRVGIAYVVAAWILLQVADLVLENIGAPDWVIQTIMLLIALGLPLALIFAWAFEMTPEGLKKEKDVDRTRSITNQTGRKLDRMIIGILAVAVVYLLVDKLVLQKKTGSEPSAQMAGEQVSAAEDEKRSLTPSGPSVAVLPFVNMSSDPEQEYFSDGLTETLLHVLAQLPELRVAARTSSFAFKGQTSSVKDIAETLGVAHILEGSVQKSGDRVRVTAQLIRANDGFHVWSQNYTRPLEDIFAIQDEIAKDVAGALDSSLLGGSLDGIRSVETANLTAYDLYLKAMEQQAIFSYGSLGEAESLFKQALAADPDFIDAKLGLVRNYIQMFNTGLIKRDALYQDSEPLIKQVRELQPDNRLARAMELVLDTTREEVFFDPVRRDQVTTELRNLLPLIPTETFIRSRVAGAYAGFLQQPEEALAVIEAGLMIDPLSAELYAQQGGVHAGEDRFEEARQSLQRANELDPRNPNYYGELSGIAAQMGDIVGKLDWIRKAAEVDPQDHELPAEIAEDLYALRLSEEGDRWARKVAALAPNTAVARKIELLRARASGDDAETLRLAEQMIDEQVANRQGAQFQAQSLYTSLMLGAGRAQEAYDFFARINPTLTDYGTLQDSFEKNIMQWNSIALMRAFGEPEEALSAWQAMRSKFDATGLPWRENPENRAWDSLMLGDPEKAADELMEILVKPLAINPDRADDYGNARWRDLAEQPKIASQMAKINLEYEQMRKDVREMLLAPEWNP